MVPLWTTEGHHWSPISIRTLDAVVQHVPYSSSTPPIKRISSQSKSWGIMSKALQKSRYVNKPFKKKKQTKLLIPVAKVVGDQRNDWLAQNSQVGSVGGTGWVLRTWNDALLHTPTPLSLSQPLVWPKMAAWPHGLWWAIKCCQPGPGNTKAQSWGRVQQTRAGKRTATHVLSWHTPWDPRVVIYFSLSLFSKYIVNQIKKFQSIP